MKRLTLLLVALPLVAHAGGSNYGITPGAHPDLAGKVSEWPVPTPRFARDPAVAPDGSIYIAVMSGNKVARFDPKTQSFKEWDLPPGHHPHGLLVDRQGMVWTTGNGNGTIGRLDPANGRVTEFKTPSGGGGPHTLIITDDQSTIWFTMQSGNKVASLQTKTGAIKEYPSSGGPYGLAFDHAGNNPNTIPVNNEMPSAKKSTRESTPISLRRGKLSGLNATSRLVPQNASTIASAPPASDAIRWKHEKYDRLARTRCTHAIGPLGLRILSDPSRCHPATTCGRGVAEQGRAAPSR